MLGEIFFGREISINMSRQTTRKKSSANHGRKVLILDFREKIQTFHFGKFHNRELKLFLPWLAELFFLVVRRLLLPNMYSAYLNIIQKIKLAFNS